MALTAFDDKTKSRKPGELRKVLGRTNTHWDQLVAHFATEYPPLDQTWNFAGAKWGGALRLRQKKRTVLYLAPLRRRFRVGFVLGGKAVKAAHESNLSDSVLTIIDEAKKYAEGYAVSIEVKNKKDRDNTVKLAEVKMAN